MACQNGAFQITAFQNDAFQVDPDDPLTCGALVITLTVVNAYSASLVPNTREANGTVPVTFR